MAKTRSNVIVIELIEQGILEFCILGTTPLICNRMSEKAKQELLMPQGRKSAAVRAGSLKHDPLAEFRASPYTSKDPKSPTLLQAISPWFKGAMKSAALDLPGIAKTQVERLIWVEGERLDLYGIPELFMAVTRNSDMNRTPDVRTRTIVPKWACKVEVTYTKPIMREGPVANLLANAGFMAGVGDYRAGKGSGTYGRYEIVTPKDPRFKALMKTGGRKAQEVAMESPDFYDDETAELYSWFQTESKRRGFKVA